MLLRQRIAIDHILPIAMQRLRNRIDDEAEVYDGELATAVEQISRNA